MIKWINIFFDRIDSARRIKYLKRHPNGVYKDRHGKRWFNSESRTGTRLGTLRKIM